MAEPLALSEAALRLLVILATQNHDLTRWRQQQSGLVKSTGKAIALVYENEIRPVLEPYRGSVPLIDELMTQREVVLSDEPVPVTSS